MSKLDVAVVRKNYALQAYLIECEKIAPDEKKKEILRKAAAKLELKVADHLIAKGDYEEAVINLTSAISILRDRPCQKP